MDNVRLALAAVTLGMETAWLFGAVALASVVIGLPVSVLSPLGVAALVATAWGVARLLDHLDISLVMAQLAGAAVGILAVTIVAQASSGVAIQPLDPFWFMTVLTDRDAPPGFGAQTLLATGMALLVWWRGVRLAQRDPGFDPMLFAFRLGLAVVAAEAVFEAFLPNKVGAAWNVVPYFTLGLMALALAHLEEIGRTQRGNAERWLWLPPAVIVVMALLAVGLALGVYAALWELVLWLISSVDALLETLFFAVLLLLGFVAEALIMVLKGFISLIGVNPSDPRITNFGRMLEELRRSQQTDHELIAFIGALFKYTIMSVLGTIVVLWLARALGRRGNRTAKPAVERDSLWTERTFSDDMYALSAAMLGLLRRRQPAWATLGDDPRGVVLRSYLQSLDVAEARGVPRPPQRTPAEFVPDMSEAFPASGESAASLTALFEAARYGNDPPTVEQGQTAVALAATLMQTAAPKREKTAGGGGPSGPQEVTPADLLGPQWRGERMGG